MNDDAYQYETRQMGQLPRMCDALRPLTWRERIWQVFGREPAARYCTRYAGHEISGYAHKDAFDTRWDR